MNRRLLSKKAAFTSAVIVGLLLPTAANAANASTTQNAEVTAAACTGAYVTDYTIDQMVVRIYKTGACNTSYMTLTHNGVYSANSYRVTLQYRINGVIYDGPSKTTHGVRAGAESATSTTVNATGGVRLKYQKITGNPNPIAYTAWVATGSARIAE